MNGLDECSTTREPQKWARLTAALGVGRAQASRSRGPFRSKLSAAGTYVNDRNMRCRSNDRMDGILSRPRCLVAEDEAIVGMMMESDLDGAGYEIVGPFQSCSDALRSLRQVTPDVALIDYKLSDGTCVELARELKSRAVSFAVLSGTVEPWVRARPEFLGVPWFAKPISENCLKRALALLNPVSIGPTTRHRQGDPAELVRPAT
jgi:CheY-like chemotaxis protein